MNKKKTLYCIGCEKNVVAELTNGKEVYPHRTDLFELPFWKCALCPAFVGCHHKTKHPYRPLGVLATQEMKELRKKIHKNLDPLWEGGLFTRKEVYRLISQKIGKRFHTAELRSIKEANDVLQIIKALSDKGGKRVNPRLIPSSLF